jgi:hypothetical protein
MFTTAKRLAESSIQASSTRPMDKETLRRKLFLRLYGTEVRDPLRKIVLEGQKAQ